MDRLAVDAPAGAAIDDGCDRPEVPFDVQVGVHVRQRQRQTEIAFELRLKREVAADLLAREAQAEAGPHVGPRQLDRHEQQWRAARRTARLRLGPRQHPEREVEHVDALLLDDRAGGVQRGQQPALQLGRRVERLQPRVGVSVGDAVRLASVDQPREEVGEVGRVVGPRLAEQVGRRRPGARVRGSGAARNDIVLPCSTSVR